MNNEYYPFINIPLGYEYDAMEPYIDTKTMRLHHDRHLQTYIDNLNKALKDKPELQRLSLEELIKSSGSMPADIGKQIHNNAGGVYNHRFFFNGLANPAGAISGELAAAIDHTFGSYDNFRRKFTEAALSVFGSGYAWLVSDNNGRLSIITTPNQNSPVEQGLTPVLAIDVWEHAYYLKHYNVRADYINDWFNIINWSEAQKNYMAR